MKIPSTVAPVAVGLVLLAIIVSTTTKNRALEGQVAEQKKFIDQREALIDSLHAELFIANSIIGRVELSLDYLNEVEPKAFIKYAQYYDHETE
jgi:hypothetical protein